MRRTRPNDQGRKAELLIARQAIRPLAGDMFLARSSDGVTDYVTSPTTCTCPAYIKGEGTYCYHRLAATWLWLALTGPR